MTDFRWDKAARDTELVGLTEAGVVAEALVLVPPDDLEAPVTVRPAIADFEDDWVQPIERALGPRAGSRVGVVSEERPLASAVGAELAVRLGDRGLGVVLVDGSIEDPSLRKALAEDGDEGLVDMVLFGVSVRKGVRRTLAPGVHLVTAGSYPLSAREVFESEAFAELLGTLSEASVVVVALPARYLEPALPALTSVVAVGRGTEGVRSLAARAEGVSVVGIVARGAGARAIGGERVEAAGPVAEAPVEAEPPGGAEGVKDVERPEEPERVEEAERSEEAEPSGEAERVEEVERPQGPERVEKAERPEVEAPAAIPPRVALPPLGAAAEEPTPVEPTPEELEPGPVRRALREPEWAPAERAPGETEPPAAPSWARVDTESLAAERRAGRRDRRQPGSVAGTLAAVLVAALVLGWLGVRELRESRPLPVEEPGGPAGAELAERPGGEQEGPPAGVEEAAEATDEGAATPPPGEGAPEEAVEGVVPAERERPAEAPLVWPGGEERAPDTGRPPPIAGPGGPYTVFVSSHRFESDARIELEELTDLGVGAAIVPTEVGDRGLWYRIAVSGGYPTLAAARAALERVQDLDYTGAWIERAQQSR